MLEQKAWFEVRLFSLAAVAAIVRKRRISVWREKKGEGRLSKGIRVDCEIDKKRDGELTSAIESDYEWMTDRGGDLWQEAKAMKYSLLMMPYVQVAEFIIQKE